MNKGNFLKSLFLGGIVLSILWVWSSEGVAGTARRNIFLGGGSTSSGFFSIAVANARVINRNVPEVRVTVLETGVTHDNLQRMGKGQIQLADTTGYDGAVAAYYGLFQYKNKPQKNLRLLFLEGISFLSIVVRAETGIKSLADLHGKRYHAGLPGTVSEFTTRLVLDEFGIKPIYIYGGMADAIEMVKEGRVVGFSKTSAAGSGALDAAILDIKSVTPVRLVSFTEEEVKRTIQMIPGQGKLDLPPGNPYSKSLGQEGPFRSVTYATGLVGSSELSEELVYKIVRAVVTDWKTDLAPIRGDLRNWDLIKNTIEITGEVATPVPLHAGTVRYFKEKGVEVPKSLLPPEWKK